MKLRRFKVKGRGYYHLITRMVAGQAFLKAEENEVLRRMMWQVADFSGLQILTYCLMSNHFHVLVEVPGKDVEVTDTELVRRYRVLYPEPTPFEPNGWKWVQQTLHAGGDEAGRLRARLLARMHDVSIFMKTLKQRFSIWYNHRYERHGTLWADRFKSVIVEGEAAVLRVVGAYIDLNPVRAGLVEDPKDYRFCGFAEAMAGRTEALRGLVERLWSGYGSNSRALAAYRRVLLGRATQPKRGDPEAVCLDRTAIAGRLLQNDAEISLDEALRCRVRYFSDGRVLGRKAFVESTARAVMDHPARRRLGPNPVPCEVWGQLTVANGLQTDVFT